MCQINVSGDLQSRFKLQVITDSAISHDINMNSNICTMSIIDLYNWGGGSCFSMFLALQLVKNKSKMIISRLLQRLSQIHSLPF